MAQTRTPTTRALIALALGTAAMFGTAAMTGCDRTDDEGRGEGPGAVRVDLERTEVVAEPEEMHSTLARNPLGWASRAERRALEDAFALGEDTPFTPPAAIGGGPGPAHQEAFGADFNVAEDVSDDELDDNEVPARNVEAP